jgi:hypothetical protein
LSAGPSWAASIVGRGGAVLVRFLEREVTLPSELDVDPRTGRAHVAVSLRKAKTWDDGAPLTAADRRAIADALPASLGAHVDVTVG